VSEPTDTSTNTATDYEQGVAKLERELAFARRNGALAVKQMHAMLAKELRKAERELEKANARNAKLRQRADDAKQRARMAEDELARIKESSTWKAGRAVVAVPARIRRLGRG
jgi:predicted  nucleic acid-binding Zn-ribbon protein